MKLNQIIYGDNREKLKDYSDNFFDGVITDPPYELNFMGQSWDASGIAYDVNLWKEVLRVAKPGSFLFCFGGTRTYHRVICAIEDAGWIVRDQMMWLYGQGFPKSTNISKQLDKEAGAEQEVIGQKKGQGNIPNVRGKWGLKSNTLVDITAPATNDAKQWEGYGTGLKPGWEPIIVAMKPLEKGLTYAQNAEKWEVAGLNIDGGRIGYQNKNDADAMFRGENKGGNSIEFNSCKIIQSDPSNKGRWPANVILSHSPDCVCVGTKQINEGAPEGGYTYNDREYQVEGFIKNNKPQAPSNRGQETVEIWACVPDCPIRIIDEQNGSGVSRFFYCAKASKAEREEGLKEFVECIKCGKFNSNYHTETINNKKIKVKCTRNNHPTVKPLDLMKYLCTLLKMPNKDQVILDPFCGSGTTLMACKELSINYIGIEQDIDSYLIAVTRVGD